MKQKQNYSIGLDIGTNSVGYAVIGENYKVLPFNRKKMWGVFLMDEAQTASARRAIRAGRRRMARRAERIRLLRELTGDSVLAKDDSFFFKLNKASFLTVAQDAETGRPINQKFNLFNDIDFTDKDYYKKYPTIYHLRYELMTNPQQADSRLVYLALHHMVKYRGNFLYDDEQIKGGGNFEKLIFEYFEAFDEIYDSNQDDQAEETDAIGLYDREKISKIIEILLDKNKYNKTKIDEIKNLYTAKLQKTVMELHIKALLGRKVSISGLYNLDEIVDDEGKKIEFAFGSEEFDEMEGQLTAEIGEFGQLLSILKDIYGALMFHEVKQGKDYISDAMMERYNTHKLHLAWLKTCLKDHKDLKYEMFYKQKKPTDNQDDSESQENTKDKKKKPKSLANYWSYINTPKACSNKDFCDYVIKVLAKLPDTQEKTVILDAIAKENFMPKQTSVANAYVPHQMNLEELKLILNNQKVYYKDLEENYDKIMSLLTFRRPYYVGVLKSDKGISPFTWQEEKIEQKIYPWNFSQLVDYEKAQERFIGKLTSYCNFCKDQPVLAKKSITYQMYETLNELNCLKLKGNLISHGVKMLIFEKLCKTTVSVSAKGIANLLKKEFGYQYKAEDITGFAGEGKMIATMSTYRAFKNIFGQDFNEKNIPLYDNIAKDLTIFTETQARADRIKDKYKLSDNIVNGLKRLKFVGWGRYSAKALRLCCDKNGKSLIDIMLEKEKHLNAILYDEELDFLEIFKINEKNIVDKLTYNQDIDSLYCSPKVKKAVWGAVKIVNELERVMGCPPQSIFIETTETDEVKKATKTRADKIKNAYSKVDKHCEYLLDELVSEKDKVVKLSDNTINDKLYLWCMQMGRCMYSEEYMPLSALNSCEIDHIVPRCFIKDDSFDNRVLVKKIENQQKSDTLALSANIRNNMDNFWKFLLSKQMISKKKYFNLIKDKYDETDSEKFINRQLVETNQIVRAVREVLVKKYPKENVQGIRANLSATLREKYMKQNQAGFFKNRLLNDLHHAKDAYLAAVLGQFVTQAYPLWGQSEDAKSYKKQMFAISQGEYVRKGKFNELVNERYGIIVDAMMSGSADMFALSDDGEYQWNETYRQNIEKQMSYNDINVVKQKVMRANGGFYKMQYFPKGGKLSPKKFVKSNSGELVPLNTKLYGGYSGEQEEYYCIVKCFKKSKKSFYEIIGVPVLDAYRIRAGKMTIEEAIEDRIKDTAVRYEVLDKLIYKYQLVRVEYPDDHSQLLYITSSVYKNNAVQLLIDYKYEKLAYLVAKFWNKEKKVINIKIKNEIEALVEKDNSILIDFATYIAEKIANYIPVYEGALIAINENINNVMPNKSLDDNVKFLEFLLSLTQAKPKQIKVPEGFEKVSDGRIQITLDPVKLEFIDQSITGLYSTVIKGSDLCQQDGDK